MHLLVPDKFIYLCAPRTGSRTTREALVKHCGAQEVGDMHHAYREELEALETELPVYSMMRDPFSYVMAAFARDPNPKLAAFARDPNPRFEDFINSWKPDCLDEWDNAMTPYEGFVHHYFIFENGLEDFFERVGFGGVPLTNKGRYETPNWKPICEDVGFGGVPLTNKGRYETPNWKPICEDDEITIRMRFKRDFDRYADWVQKNERPAIV
jgi:hypothetical protein